MNFILQATVKIFHKITYASHTFYRIIENKTIAVLTMSKDHSLSSTGETLACRLKYDYIFVASCYWKQIREQLLALGVDKNKIRCPLAPVRIERFKKEYGEIYNIWGKINFYCKKWYLAEQFHPDWLGILVNPYFFSRKKLYEDIVRYSSCLYGTCMDFGCGTQPYKGLLHVDEYIGVEIETDDKREGIIYYDGHRLPFADERFDSIISSEVFEHIDNVEEILAELYRVLKDGGVMLLTVPFVYPKHCWPFDYKRYTTQGLKSLVANAGFECTECIASSSYWECIAQLKNVYWEEEVQTKTVGGFLAKRLLTVFNNLNGVLADKALPYSDKLYLDNVIIVKKSGLKD